MKKLFATLIFAAIGAVMAMAAGTVQRTLEIRDFDKLEINWVFDVEVLQADDYAVNIEVSEEVLPYIDIRMENGTLFLRVNDLPSSLTNRRNWNPVVKAKISMPVLNGLTMTEASKLKTIGKFKADADFILKASETASINNLDLTADKLDISCGGATKLTLNGAVKEAQLNLSGATKSTLTLQAGNISVNASEAAKVKVSGSTGVLGLNCSGACDINLSQTATSEASIKLTGATKCQLNVLNSLSVELSGASSCQYTAGENLDLKVVSLSKGASLKKL